MQIVVEIGFLFLLILLNAGFALAEMALVSSRRAALALLAQKHVRGAVHARLLAEAPDRFLPTVQIGITAISIMTGVVGGAKLATALTPLLRRVAFIAPAAGTVALIITIVLVTFLTLVCGELVPKQLALRNAERIACAVAWPIDMFARVAAPAVWLLGATSDLLLRAFGPADPHRRAISEEELKAILAEGTASGMLESEERDMMERVMRLADKPVRAIMTPRQDIAWLDRTAPRGQVITALKAAPHSRFVVCDRSIDNVVGIVQAKDILDRMLDGKDISIATSLRQPLAVPDAISALDALERLKADPLGVAFVLDEYGSFEGMVTVGDLLEAIVGDVEEPTHAEGGETVPERFELDGLEPIDEVAHRLRLIELPAHGSYHTLGGFLLALLKRVPRQGDAIAFGGWRFEVLAMNGRRVERVRISRDPTAVT
ncbi:hemolysin family protein [Acidiphilium sp. AL]|uniref:Hemolysin family protein n=1 Tax=Acidiphilium iwatense TaxID=768198 RepID=A0ABS9DSM9_9PROT|nr:MULTISPECIES: hemolysin family protein [Acidiphilium]MCF3945743.1 hemolysin family protein [Acidiphilium iwatense]MCU4159324.1 hemolysin family protein [Acidiphilium sp. AL]